MRCRKASFPGFFGSSSHAGTSSKRQGISDAQQPGRHLGVVQCNMEGTGRCSGTQLQGLLQGLVRGPTGIHWYALVFIGIHCPKNTVISATLSSRMFRLLRVHVTSALSDRLPARALPRRPSQITPCRATIRNHHLSPTSHALVLHWAHLPPFIFIIPRAASYGQDRASELLRHFGR